MSLIKSIALSTLLSLASTGCSLSNNSNWRMGRIAQERDIPAIDKILREMIGWKYKFDLFDRWQTPEETERKKEGNCSDFSIYIIEKLHEQDIAAHPKIGYLEGNFGFHFWVEVPYKDSKIVIESVRHVGYLPGPAAEIKTKDYHEISPNILIWLKMAEYNNRYEREKLEKKL